MTNMWQHILLFLFIGLLTCCAQAEETKWSRQLDSAVETGGESSLDWIPLTQANGESASTSKDRSENARLLSYSQTFPPNARFVDFQKPPAPPLSQPHSYDFPYNFQRFPNNQLKQSNAQSQEPTSQSFFKFEMPFRNDGGRLSAGQPPLQTGYQIQHSFGNNQGQATLYSSQLYNNQPLYNTDYRSAGPKPLQQAYQRKPNLPQQNFIDEALPLKHTFRESKPSQQSLQSVTPQVFPLNPKPDSAYEVAKPTAFPTQSIYRAGPSTSTAATPQQEEVQLVYVPYDTFFNKQQQQQQQAAVPAAPGFNLNRFNLNSALPAVNPYQINQFYTQDPLAQEHNYYTPSTTSRPKTTSYSPNILQNFADPQYTTPKPKPKAHQPPLAMFLMRHKSRPSQSDVVAALRNSETIDVIDGPTKKNPRVFVGPAGMPIPEGFVKFDLPYLSQLAQSSNLNEVPFFVAPLSYRTPNGFNKILLPEPHVGSIVVNRAKDIVTTPAATTYTTELNEYTETTPRPRTHHQQRIKQVSSTKSYYPELQRDPGVKTRTQYEVATQRPAQSVRGNKFTYYVDQEVLPEVTKVKAERPKKKRPQSVQVEQPAYTQSNNQYPQYNSVPNQIANNEYYKVQSSRAPTTTSTSTTTTTTTTTSTLPPPTTYFPYNSSPQVEFHSSSGQLYPSYNSIVNSQVPDNTLRYTTQPTTTADDEEYRVKQYYRQPDTKRNRPQNLNPTYSPFEQVQYTPIEVTIPSSTAKPGKQRFTYYTPMDTTTPSQAYDTSPPQEATEKTLPANHRPSYNPNELSEGNLEYEPNPYQLPSELPPLTPNLPGLVNNLQEKHKALLAEHTTPMNEIEIPTRATRRPINRVRKPAATKVTSSVSYSESESSAKRPTHRVRRPYGTRGSTDVNSEFEEPEATTRRSSFPTRNPTVRNPNRIRYQPTPEERQSFRVKLKKGSKKGEPAEDLEYQRDVLNQNYPVFRPSSSRKTTSPTAIPSSYAVATSENPTSESQQVYTVTPSNEQVFPAGMLEPMQIAQQYNQYSKDNYGPGYFPNQEELNPTEPVRNEINPIYTASTTPSTTTTSTSNTEEPQTTTKRSLFLRRNNYSRLRPTTTDAPITTTQASEERQTARPRIPPRKVIKVRTRNRRPLHPASSTKNPTEEDAEPEPVKNNFRKVNRFNQDLYENDTPKRRYKTQFHLEGQESQWSPSTDDSTNNFSPLDPKEANKETHNFEIEPDIVTVGPARENKQDDTYEVKVSADYGSKQRKSNFRGPNLKPEKSFAEMLEEVMGKAPVEKPLDEDEEESTTKTTDGTYFESQKTTISNKLNRRGKWKKLRNQASNHQNDSFEAAESQNLGEQLFNKYYTDTNKFIEQIKSTTPMTYSTESSTSLENSVTDYATENSFEAIATSQMETTTPLDSKTTTLTADIENHDTVKESATRRLDMDVATESAKADDLESEPSIFSEVKKQLHELFAIDDSEDQAVTAALSAVKRRHEYKSIKRTRPPLTTTENTVAEESSTTMPAVGTTTALPAKIAHQESSFKNPMEHLVYATSTATKVSSETEICYRGRCIKSEDLPRNHKLQ